MRGALSASLKDETTAFQERTAQGETAALQDRFARANAAIGEIPAGDNRPAAARVVRDTFSFPEDDHRRIQTTRDRALQLGLAINKSEVLRAGLAVLEDLTDEQFQAVIARLERVQTGRPSKIS